MMLEVLRQDYIRTAWPKGLKERHLADILKARHQPSICWVRTMWGETC